MYFIKGNVEKTIISFDDQVAEKEMSVNKFLKKLSIHNLCTLEGRKIAIKKKYGFKSKVPIYVNKNVILILITPKREYEKVYINARKVLEVVIENGKTCICFKDKKLETTISKRVIKRLLEKASIIERGEL